MASGAGGDNAPAEVGKKLFPDFNDPLAAKSLEIVHVTTKTPPRFADFKVAQVNGVWSIPSHSNYPADANEHMAQAATALLDLEILGVVSTSPGDQELYGVIAPDPQKLRRARSASARASRSRTTRTSVLADLVIGKEVKDQPALRYVRRADRDQIYHVDVKTDKLSTKFEDWIEKDLLKLNAFDVREVELNDYSLDEGVTQRRRHGAAASISAAGQSWASTTRSRAWNLIDLAEFDEKGKPVPAKLADDEELNTEKLNAPENRARRPANRRRGAQAQGTEPGSAGQRRIRQEQRGRCSLVERGFYPVRARRPTRNLLQRRRSHLHDQGRRALRAALRPPGRRRGQTRTNEKPDEKERATRR